MFEVVLVGVVMGTLAYGFMTRVALREARLPDPRQPGLDG